MRCHSAGSLEQVANRREENKAHGNGSEAIHTREEGEDGENEAEASKDTKSDDDVGPEVNGKAEENG